MDGQHHFVIADISCLSRLPGRRGAPRGPDLQTVFQPEGRGGTTRGRPGDGLLHGGGGRRLEGADAGGPRQGCKAKSQALRAFQVERLMFGICVFVDLAYFSSGHTSSYNRKLQGYNCRCVSSQVSPALPLVYPDWSSGKSPGREG